MRAIAQRRIWSCAISVGLLIVVLSGRAFGGEFSDPKLGYGLTYPEGWHAVVIGDVLMLLNVPELEHGGVLPPNGAKMTVQVRDSSIETEDEMINKLTRYMPVPGTPSRETVEGRSVVSLTQTYGFAPDEKLVRTAMATRVGTKTLLVVLDYNADDANKADYERTLRHVVSSGRVEESPQTLKEAH